MMKRLFILPLVALLALTAIPANAQDDLNPVRWSQTVTDEGGGRYLLTFRAVIDAPWHLYDLGPYVDGPNPTTFTFSHDARVDRVGDMTQEGALVRKFDPVFKMEIGYFSGTADFKQVIQLKDSTQGATMRVNVEWMACDDTSCLPPADRDFAVAIGPHPTAAVPAAADEPAGGSSGKSLWGLIIEAILWGFAALLTPCVFPMVPMTVSFFLKGSENKSRGRVMASFYGLFIVLLYTVPIAVIILVTRMIGGEAVTADIFNWLATHWLPNILFFLVFMLFAASFFGAFEITLPGWMTTKSDQKADRGGLLGVFFMALTLVLVSFSCTGPIVGTVLIKSTSGEIWTPIVTMLAFSIAFALPFVLFALFPSLLSNLPKSGGWLNSVKVVLGFVELALGLKFLSVADQTYHWGLLDREVYLALWIVIFALLGIYLLGKIKFKHDSDLPYVGVGRLTLAILVFSFVVYLIPGMWGAPLKAISGYLPPITTQDFVLDKYSVADASTVDPADQPPKYSDFLKLPYGLHGYFDFDEAVAAAQRSGKPILVDFTGHGCVNCREMEARVWTDPQVLELLRDRFVILALYSDDKKQVDKSNWVTTENGKVLKGLGKINSHLARTRFGANAQPYYIILDSSGNQLGPGRGYNLDADAFRNFLLTGLERFRAAE